MFPTRVFLVNISKIPGSFSCAVRSKSLLNKCLLGICINSFQVSLSPNLSFRKLFTSDIPGKQVFSTKTPGTFPGGMQSSAGDIAARITVPLRQLQPFSSLILFCPVTHVVIAFCTRSKTIHLGLFKMLTLLLFS